MREFDPPPLHHRKRRLMKGLAGAKPFFFGAREHGLGRGLARREPVLASQTLTRRSGGTVAMRAPSALKAIEEVGPSPRPKAATARPVAASHDVAVDATCAGESFTPRLAVRMRAPSGLKSAPRNPLSLTRIAVRRRPVVTFQTSATPSEEPPNGPVASVKAVRARSPSGLKSMVVAAVTLISRGSATPWTSHTSTREERVPPTAPATRRASADIATSITSKACRPDSTTPRARREPSADRSQRVFH